MTRFPLFAALAVATLAPAPALAQPGVAILDAKIDKDRLRWTETAIVPVQQEVVVTVNINGMNVIEKRTVTVNQIQLVTREESLKGAKVTDGSGKAVTEEKAAELLKEPRPVVVLRGPLPDKHRALFKDATLFIELPAQPQPPK